MLPPPQPGLWVWPGPLLLPWLCRYEDTELGVCQEQLVGSLRERLTLLKVLCRLFQDRCWGDAWVYGEEGICSPLQGRSNVTWGRSGWLGDPVGLSTRWAKVRHKGVPSGNLNGGHWTMREKNI